MALMEVGQGLVENHFKDGDLEFKTKARKQGIKVMVNRQSFKKTVIERKAR